MKGYSQVTLMPLVDRYGEESVKAQLSSFSCPQNKDVEDYLLYKAITLAKQSVTVTHLVYASFKDEPVLVGYYALTNKIITISEKTRLSKSFQRRLNKFAKRPCKDLPRSISAPLIAQLGKNYTNSYNELISGDELLQMACDRVQETQLILGGKIVYIECEDTPKLVDFYTRNDFHEFDKRPKAKDEKELYKSDYLVQMLKYFS